MIDTYQIAEVSRIVHYLKKHAVGKTIEAIKAQEDDVSSLESCNTCKELKASRVIERL